MKHGFFVTGTDTGVGKTLISSALVHHFAQAGYRSAGMKPVAAGCELVDGRLLSDDVVQLRAAGNVALPLEIVNPYAFAPPLAPHIAAGMAQERIALDVIEAAFRQAADAVDILVVEGVGGFRVPLNDDQDTADLAVRLNLPVVLVVGMRLGCLNHALLTVESIASRGLELAGWVANGIDPQMSALQENVHALANNITSPCLGVVSYHSRLGVCSTEAELWGQALRKLVCA